MVAIALTRVLAESELLAGLGRGPAAFEAEQARDHLE